ncbi:MAG: hypothetical protein AB8G99_02430 [Planctomycetaceae bacterium]
MSRKYEFNKKHAAAKGNISKMDLSDVQAQQLLNSGTCFAAKSSAYIAVLNKRKIYAFRMHAPNTYHGYPIPGQEVCSSFPEVQDAVAKAMGITVKRLSRMR